MMSELCVALMRENWEAGVLPLNYSRSRTKRKG
jgi:hypothetical protein